MYIRRTILIFILLLGFSLSLNAQQITMSPIVAEFQAKTNSVAIAEGQVSVRNDGLFPVITTLEAESFSISNDGQQMLTSLDPNISIRWDNSSARIPAHQEHVFSYRVSCPKAPCWFLVMSTVSGPRTKTVVAEDNQNIAVALALPSLVYIYGKKAVKESDLQLSWTGNDLHIENTSDQIIRSTNVEAHYKDGHTTKSGAFPMFPSPIGGSSRTFRFTEKPDYVLIHFKKFTLDTRKYKCDTSERK